jgi:hypothetical protein
MYVNLNKTYDPLRAAIFEKNPRIKENKKTPTPESAYIEIFHQNEIYNNIIK